MADSILTSVLPSNSVRPLINCDEVSTAYVDNMSNIAQKEDMVPNNDVIQGFSSYAPGATSNFRIGKTNQFLNAMFVRFTIQNVTAFQTSSDYLAYNLIKSVRYQVGATEQLTIFQESMLDFLHEQCEDNDEKKVLLHELAGYAAMPPATSGLLANQTYIYALLPLPWSTLKANKIRDNQKPFPLHALQDNIEIFIELNSLSAINSGYFGTYGPATPFAASNLVGASLLWRLSKIGNYQQMMTTKIKYPFKQVIARQIANINAAASGSQQSITLQGFRKGEICDILFHLSDGTDVYRGLPMSNINLLFNGTKIWNANSSDRFWDLVTADQPSTYGKKRYKIAGLTGGLSASALLDANNALITNTQVTGNYIEVDAYGLENSAFNPSLPNTAGTGVATSAGTDVKNYYYGIPIGEIRLKMLESLNNYALAGDFSKQSLVLTFNMPYLATGTANYVLYASYVYTGVYIIDEYGSATLAF